MKEALSDEARIWQMGRLRYAAWSALAITAGLAELFAPKSYEGVTLFAPLAGVALAAMTSGGWRALLSVLLGALSAYLALATLVDGGVSTPLRAAGTVLSLLGQTLIGFFGLRWLVGRPMSLIEPWDIGRFGVVCAVASLAGALLYGMWGGWVLSKVTTADQMAAWWLAHGLGGMVIAPVVLAWAGHPQEDWRPRRLALAAPLAVLLLATVVGVAYVEGLDADRHQQRFEREASSAAAVLAAQLLVPTHALEALRGVWLSTGVPDRAAFQRITQAWLDRPENHLYALGWSERLSDADIPHFESRAWAEGFEGLRVVSAVGGGRTRPVVPGEPILAIRYVEPYEANRLAPGTNSWANPPTARAIEASIRTDAPAATAAFPLRLPGVVSGDSSQGVVVYRALYSGQPVLPQERLAQLKGAVFVTLRMSEVLASTAASVPLGYALCLVDYEGATTPVRLAGEPGCESEQAGHVLRRELRFADRSWMLVVSAPLAQTVATESGAYARLFAVLALGGVAGLGILLLAVTGRTRQMERAVVEADRARAVAVTASRSKSEFLSRMSHELRTPLNAVLGFSQLLESDTTASLSPLHRRWVGNIRQSGWHLLDMINDVLDLSRVESDRLEVRTERVPLQPVIDECLAMVEYAAQAKGVTVATNPEGRTLAARGDPIRIKQILTNLLSNAVKYNVPDGRVDVCCRESKGMVEIEVRDSGLGMTEAQLEELFQPFNRLGREQTDIPGTGIGLVISRSLAEAMGGRLTAYSRQAQGSRFVLCLPKDGTSCGYDPLIPEGRVLQRSQTPRLVYCIEDNATNIEILRGILAARPEVRLEAFGSGRAALAAMRALVPDVVLLDLHLPDMDGLNLLEQFRAEPAWAQVPVLVVTADAMGARIDAARQAGAVSVMTKPLHIRRFVQALDSALATAPCMRR